jgi:L-ascorbate metabolism protein UlaG (beta-lactamase superfamily)
MSTRLRWLGHSAFHVETDGTHLLIDPFLTGNPKAAAKPDELPAHFILVSHGHGDHVGDTVAIAKRTGATVVANYEIALWLQKQGVDKVHPMHLGGGHKFPFGRLKFTVAHHGSGLPDGSYGGNPAGFHLYLNDGSRIYFAGDTALFGDMRLIGDEGVDLAMLPIGDNFTMGPDDSLRAIQFLNPRQVLPIHYDTWDLIAQDAKAWADRVRETTGATPVVLEPGGSLQLR